MPKKPEMFCVVDTEWTSSPAGEMLTCGLVVLERGLQRSFYGEFRPSRSAIWDDEAIRVMQITPAMAGGFPTKERMTKHLLAWLEDINPNGESEITLVSDNPTFDIPPLWQVCYHFGNKSTPFGHSGRRIGDLYCGLVGKWGANKEWKSKYRPNSELNHNALDDALANAQALIAINDAFGLNIPGL